MKKDSQVLRYLLLLCYNYMVILIRVYYNFISCKIDNAKVQYLAFHAYNCTH